MPESSGKAVYTKPAQPEVITSVDLALNAAGGTGNDGPFIYASI